MNQAKSKRKEYAYVMSKMWNSKSNRCEFLSEVRNPFYESPSYKYL